MIVYPAQHLFEAKFPKLEDHEEEVFFHHPVEEIYCNQLGALYYESSSYVCYDKNESNVVRNQKTGKNVGTKIRVIWECYTGKIVTNPHFLFVNGNPLDTRRENMRKISELPKKEWEALQSVKKRFIQKSVEHLVKLEERASKMGLSNSELNQILMLPYWLVSARRRLGDTPTKTNKIPGPKARTTEEQADEIEKLYLQGLTYYAILQKFGWNSNHRVKKVVRDRGLSR